MEGATGREIGINFFAISLVFSLGTLFWRFGRGLFDSIQKQDCIRSGAMEGF